jgi:dihydroxyacetone kinase-like predicted kinase
MDVVPAGSTLVIVAVVCLWLDVDITTTHIHTRQQDLKLEENVAYGHFNAVATWTIS